MISNEKAREILDNAPNGCTHIEMYGSYIKWFKHRDATAINDNKVLLTLASNGDELNGVHLSTLKDMTSIDDLRAQLDTSVEWDKKFTSEDIKDFLFSLQFYEFSAHHSTEVENKVVEFGLSIDDVKPFRVQQKKSFEVQELQREIDDLKRSALHNQVCSIMKGYGHDEDEYTTNRGSSITYATIEQMLEDGYRLEAN